MVSALIVGVNTYGTLEEANTYLGDSFRAASWATVLTSNKVKALISAFRLLEKQHWQGASTGVQIVDEIAVAAGGAGYAVDDVLTVDGGVFGEAATAKVTTEAAGVVTGLQLIHAGTYSTAPTSPAATTGGTGTGATVTLTMSAQTADFPRTGLTDCNDAAVSELIYPSDIKAAQFELAYEISVQGAALETASGTGSNIKSVKAGSAAVEFFRYTSDSQRFPTIVMELLGCYLASTMVGGGIFTSGTDGVSEFKGWPSGYGLIKGL